MHGRTRVACLLIGPSSSAAAEEEHGGISFATARSRWIDRKRRRFAWCRLDLSSARLVGLACLCPARLGQSSALLVFCLLVSSTRLARSL